jgi:hypothetical protein
MARALPGGAVMRSLAVALLIVVAGALTLAASTSCVRQVALDPRGDGGAPDTPGFPQWPDAIDFPPIDAQPIPVPDAQPIPDASLLPDAAIIFDAPPPIDAM